jgi:hypothetical protein
MPTVRAALGPPSSILRQSPTVLSGTPRSTNHPNGMGKLFRDLCNH